MKNMTKFCACLLKKEEAKLIIENVYMMDILASSERRKQQCQDLIL